MDEGRIRRAIRSLGFRPRVAEPSDDTPPPRLRGNVPEPVAAALARAAESGDLVLLDFLADWCAPCKVMERRVLPDPAVQRALVGYLLVRVDTDRFPQAGRFFGVDVLPTLIALTADGRELSRLVGIVDVGEIARELSRVRDEVPRGR